MSSPIRTIPHERHRINRPILITSFRPWRVHQRSNSSDDMIAALQQSRLMPPSAVWLRHLPVNFDLAPAQVESEIRRLRPRAVICCGMAESRLKLCVEKQARYLWPKPSADELSPVPCSSPYSSPCLSAPSSSASFSSTLHTDMDVNQLIAGTVLSEVSEDAGTYVCNHLYYRVLNLTNDVDWTIASVFIHIPVLTSDNKRLMVQDFSQIVNKINRDSLQKRSQPC